MEPNSLDLWTAEIASYRFAWIAYQWGDRDPQVKRMAGAFRRWVVA